MLTAVVQARPPLLLSFSFPAFYSLLSHLSLTGTAMVVARSSPCQESSPDPVRLRLAGSAAPAPTSVVYLQLPASLRRRCPDPRIEQRLDLCLLCLCSRGGCCRRARSLALTATCPSPSPPGPPTTSPTGLLQPPSTTGPTWPSGEKPSPPEIRPVMCFFLACGFRHYPENACFTEKSLVFMHTKTHQLCIGFKCFIYVKCLEFCVV